MRTRLWCLTLVLAALGVACGDQPTEVAVEREAEAGTGMSRAPGATADATASSDSGLVISTDKDDYQPGDTVYLTGEGWSANDVLDIVLTDNPQTHAPHEWTVTVAEDGTFRDSTYLVDQGDLDVTFTLVATSRSTQRSLSIMFTDANISNSMALTPNPLFVPRGGSNTTTVSVSFGGNDTQCTASLSVTGLPSGASGSLTPTSVTGNPSDSPKTAVLTISTSASTPLGPDPYTVTATAGTGCDGAASRSASGTLTVFGAAARLAFGQQPTSTVANATVIPSVTVLVQDGSGNLVANSTASVTLAITTNPGGGSLGGTVTRNAVNGVATFDNLSIDKVGNGYRLTATSGTLTSTTSSLFNIVFGPPASLVFSTQPSGGSPNTAFPTQPVVQVRDAIGNLITSGGGSTAGITLSTASGTGTAGAALTCTPSNTRAASGGVAAFAGCRINFPGTGYRLRATSGAITADSDLLDITPVNQAPSVDAGSYTVAEGTELILGPVVADPEGDPLTYHWTVNPGGIDNGGTCTIDDDTAKAAKLTCTDDSQGAGGGKFTMTLEVNDGHGHTVSDVGDLTVTNAAPQVQAGGPYAGSEGAPIQLTGFGDDPGNNDDGHLGYQWTVVTTGIDAGGSCSFDNAASRTAKVTCTDDGAFTVKLVASDDDGSTSVVSQTDLTVANAGPVAEAGGPYNGQEGSPVQLNGTVTDAGANDTHVWLWKYVSGAGIDGGTCSFDNENAQDPKITCTDDGTVQLTLKVTDDDETDAVDTATLTLANVDPVASAGGSYTGSEGSPVQLNGSVTDAGSNDTHTWSWQYVGTNIDPGATCGLSNPAAEDPTIICTDNGTVKLTLTVTDDDGGSDSDEATLTLSNVNPVATAGGPYVGDEGAAVQLTGTAADAGSNDVLTRAWTYAAVSGVDAGATCSFSPNASALSPTVSCTDDGVYKVTLAVSDDDGGSDVAYATLTLSNVAPVADAGGPYAAVAEGGEVQLLGSATDQGTNDSHTYKWTVDATGIDGGGSCTIASDTQAGTTVSCDDNGTLKVTLVATDDDGSASASSQATITITNATPAITAFTRADGTDLPTTLIVAGTIGLKVAFDDAGGNDSHMLEVDCGQGFRPPAPATSPASDSCTFPSIGSTIIKVKVADDDGGTHIVTHTIVVKYDFDGFYAPVDRPNTMNVSKAGQAIPLKWTLRDANGTAVTDLVSVTIKTVAMSCDQSVALDPVEEYANSTSGLMNLGGGRYQFNWKTASSLAGTCKSIALVFGSGGLGYTEGPHAFFSFKR